MSFGLISLRHYFVVYLGSARKNVLLLWVLILTVFHPPFWRDSNNKCGNCNVAQDLLVDSLTYMS